MICDALSAMKYAIFPETGLNTDQLAQYLFDLSIH